MCEQSDTRGRHSTFVLKGREEDEEEKMMTGKNEMDKEDDEGVPVDTGWAWVIAVCVHVMLTLIFGFDRAISVLFVDFTEQFEQSATVISLIFTVEALSSSISVLFIASKIMPRFSVRSICCVAGISTSVVTICISRAPNIALFLLLFVFKGMCFQAILVGTLSMIGYYFKTRRALASSIANAGLCMAYISIPPITDMLRLEYGTRGCLLIIAGLELHLTLFGLLLRPVDSYKKVYTNRVKVQEKDGRGKLEEMPVLENAKNGYLDLVSSGPNTKVQTFLDGTTEEHIQLVKGTRHTGDPVTSNEQEKAQEDGHTVPDVLSRRMKANTIYHDISTESRPTVCHSLKSNLHDLGDKHILSSSLNKSLLNDMQAASSQNDEGKSGQTTASVGTEVTCDVISDQAQTASNQFKSTSCHGSYSKNNNNQYCDTPSTDDTAVRLGNQICPPSSTGIGCSDLSYTPASDKADVEEIPDDVADDNNENKTMCLSWLKDVIDLSLFKIWRFRMMSLYIMFAVYINFLPMYMPAIGYTAGIDKSDAAFLLTISGVTDLITRIVLGCIGDYPWASVSKMVAFSTLVIGVVSQFTRYITTYAHFVVFALIVGSAAGVHQNFLNVLLVEYVGVDNFSKAFAIIAMLATLTISVTFPVVGAMVDATGSFVTPLHFAGTMILLVSLVLFCEPIFKRLDENNLAKKRGQ